MGFWEKFDKAFFPYDFSKINKQGLFLCPHSYSLYRLTMSLLSLTTITLLKLYDPGVKYPPLFNPAATYF